jgi:hypothetical protein
MYRNIRYEADPLELTAIGMTDTDASHPDEDAARDSEIRPLTICSGSRTPDEGRAMYGAQRDGRMFRLALGAVIDQHHRLTWVRHLMTL